MARILVVDDEPSHRRIIERILAAAGHETVTAADGREAVRKYREENPDLVILDVMMPVMNGFEAAREIRRAGDSVHAPILFLSAACPGASYWEEGLDAGGSDYLAQPVSGEELLFRIRVLLEAKKVHDHLLRTLEKLEEREQHLRSLAEVADDGIITVDGEGRIVFFNPAAARMFGYGDEGIAGRSVTELMPESARASHREAFERAVAAEDTPRVRGAIEMPGRKKDGTTFPAELAVSRWQTGGRVFFTAIIRDITRRKSEERSLRESEERFRVLFESSYDMMCIADMKGRVRWSNPAWQRVLGGVPGDRKSLQANVHPEDSGRLERAWETLGRDEGCDEIFRFRYRLAGGGYANLKASLRRLSLSKEPLVSIVAQDVTEITLLRKKARIQKGIPGIVGRDVKIVELFGIIKEVARFNAPILVEGESGTGKELVAAAIHRESRRRGRFVPVNCAALPDGLLESELFGHVRGAFTGAVRDKRGRFELADGGTIFFDEISELSPAMQVKLLRVLQESAFERVGGEQTMRVDVRVISATNRELREEVRNGRFRDDLFYRLSVVPISLPPLRERRSDIPLLAEHILDELLSKGKDGEPRQRISIEPEAMSLLMSHSWPGNVRELQNVLSYALIKCRDGVLRREHLPRFLAFPGTPAGPGRRAPKLTVRAVEEALERSGGNRLQAARLLGVSRATLYRFLARLS